MPDSGSAGRLQKASFVSLTIASPSPTTEDMSYRSLGLSGVLLSFAFVIQGCAQSDGVSPSTQPQASEKDAIGRYPLSTKSRWNVVKKACGDTLLTADGETPTEYYLFDSGLLVQISSYFLVSDRQICTVAHAYQRVISDFKSSGYSYAETSTLSSSALRTVCRTALGGPIVSDKTISTPADLSYLTLTKTGDKLSVTITGSAECPAAELKLELTQASEQI